MADIKDHNSLDILKEATERLNQRDYSLLRRNYQLSTLVEILKLLLQNNDRELFQKIVIMVSSMVETSNVYLFKNEYSNSGIKMVLVHEIKKESTHSYTHISTSFDYEDYPVFSLYMNSHQPFHIKVTDIPLPERELFEKMQIKATLRLPLHVKNLLWGFIGFDNCYESTLWKQDDINVLHNVAVSLELYLKQKETEKELKNLIAGNQKK